MTRIPVNGIELNVRRQGNGPALLLLHGFTGSGATWQPFDWPGYETVAVDLPGHGESDKPAGAERYRMERCLEDLVSLLDELGLERAAVLGYSLGGRVALHLALHAPERLWALVIESASPGIESEAERAERRRSDGELADSIMRDGIAPFVDRWQAIPLFASQQRLPTDVRQKLRQQRLRNDPAGLANSLRGLGAGEQQPVYTRLHEIATPALLLAGADDAKYRAIAERTTGALPCARLRIVPEAGHAVHLEQPQAFSAAVREFLSACLQEEERTPCR